MAADVGQFEATCAALADPRSAAAAGEALTALRAQPSALNLARAVLETSSDRAAAFQAVLLLRDASLRLWPSLALQDRHALRTWALAYVAGRWGSLDYSAATSLVVVVAVLWKRGWLDETDDGRAVLFDQLRQLYASGGGHRMLAAKLSLALIQEFDATAGGKASAVGLSGEFHAQAAARFQATGLREVFALAAQLLLGHLAGALPGVGGGAAQQAAPPQLAPSGLPSGLDRDLTLASLHVISECLAWDFSGGRGAASTASAASGGRAPLRKLTPGRGWRDLLADGNHTLLRALLALYDTLRPVALVQHEVALVVRQCLLACCALAPDTFDSPAAYGVYAREALAGLSRYLQAPLVGPLAAALCERAHAVAAATPSAACAGGGAPASHAAGHWQLDDALELGDDEAQDFTEGLGALVRVGGVAALVAPSPSGGVGGGDCGALLAFLAAAEHATVTALDTIASAAGQVTAAVTDSGGSRAALARARRHVQVFLEVRFAMLSATVDALLELWAGVVYGLQAAAAGSDAAALAPVADATRRVCAGLFERLVRGRLAMATAIIRADIDDDDPFEDKSSLASHMELVAVLGRHAPAPCLNLLMTLLGDAHARLRLLGSTGGHVLEHNHQSSSSGGTPGGATPLPSPVDGDVDTELGVANEEVWWLVTYAGHLLADEARGETPLVPDALNAVSWTAVRNNGLSDVASALLAPPAAPGDAEARAALRPQVLAALAGCDPVARLSNAVLAAAAFEVARLLASPSSHGLSPLLSTQLLWFAGRWARTYLLPSAGTYSRDAPLSPSLRLLYGADAGGVGAVDDDGSGPPPNEGVGSDVLAAIASGRATSTPLGLLEVPLGPADAGGGGGLPSPLAGAGAALGGVAGAAGGGRAVLDFLLQAAATALALWGPSEPAIATHALWLLRAVTNNDCAARAAVLSPAWRHLASGTLAMASTGAVTAAVAIPAGPFPLPSTPGEMADRCARVLPLLVGLPAEPQGQLVQVLLAPTRQVGAETPGWSWLARAPGADVSSEPERTAAGGPPDAAMVVARWRAYFDAFLGAVGGRLQAALAGLEELSPSSEWAGGSGARLLCVTKDVDRAYAMMSGVVNANPRLPDAWHFGATGAALAAAGRVVRAYAGGSPVCMRVLRFILDFLDADLDGLSPGQAGALYGAITAVFQAYAAHHAAVATSGAAGGASAAGAGSPVGPAGAGSATAKSNSSSGRIAAANAEEDDAYEDLTALLQILERVIEKEDVQLGGGGGGCSSGDGGVLTVASEAVVTGLRFLLPLMTPSLLAYPRLSGAYLSVVGQLVEAHPQQVAGLDAPTFATFIASLEYGLRSTDATVAVLSAQAMASLATFHASAARRGFAQFPGLSRQLAAAPDLFRRLLSCVLGVLVGTHPPARELVPAASDALLALMASDGGDSYRATVEGLLAAQAAAATASGSAASGTGSASANVERLTSEFNSLTAAAVAATGAMSAAAAAPGGLAGRQATVKAREEKARFRERAEAFVGAARGLLTVK